MLFYLGYIFKLQPATSLGLERRGWAITLIASIQFGHINALERFVLLLDATRDAGLERRASQQLCYA